MAHKHYAKYIDRGLFYSPYYIGLCTSEKQFNQEIKARKVKGAKEWLGPHSDARTHLFENTDEKGFLALVCVDKKNKRKKTRIAGVLAHEATHVWQAVKEVIGETHPSYEFEAYCIQSITTKLMEAYYG